MLVGQHRDRLLHEVQALQHGWDQVALVEQATNERGLGASLRLGIMHVPSRIIVVRQGFQGVAARDKPWPPCQMAVLMGVEVPVILNLAHYGPSQMERSVNDRKNADLG
jgi:hypothetical protein